VFAGVAVLVGGFTIFNSLSITVAQRTRELGLLRMVGATRRQVRRGVLLEALAIGTLASGAGLGVGIGLAKGLNALFATLGLDLPQIGLVLSTRTIVASLLVGTLATVLAALLPARRATRIAPIAALRDGGPDHGRVRRSARLVRAVASVLGRPAERLGGAQETVNAVDPATVSRLLGYRFTAGSLAGLAGDGAVVDGGFATKHHLHVGDAFTLTSLQGTRLRVVVRGIEKGDVQNPLGLGPVTIAQSTFARAFAQPRNRLTLVDGPEDAVRRALARFPEVKVAGKAAFVDDQTAWIGQVLAILWVLLALAVIVSLFGIVNTLVLSTFERMRELGTLRALGMHRRQVRRMVRHESAITALIGAVLGIAALAGMAPAALPARRAARVDVLSALAYE
jgi:putative ABC transport system permease protein